MRIFKDMPKIYRGPIYIIFAIDLWLVGKLTFFRPLPSGFIDYPGPVMLMMQIGIVLFIALGIFGIIYTFQGLRERIKKKRPE
jgi:hypothetical protein